MRRLIEGGGTGEAAPARKPRNRRAALGQALLGPRAMAAVVAGLGLLSLPFLLFGLWGAANVDRGIAEREAALVAATLERRFEQVSLDQATVTIWDDSVTRSRAEDQTWMTENLGRWLHEFYAADRVYVLDARNRPVHAMRDGETLAPAVWEEDAPLVAPLVAALRRLIADSETDAIGDALVRDLVMLDGVPTVVSLRAIVPETDRITVPRGEEYLHLSFRRLDAAFLEDIAEATLVVGLRLETEAAPDGEAGVPVRPNAGPPLGHLAWRPATPGSDLLREALPGFATSSALVLLLVGGLASRLIEAARRLQSSQREATEASLRDGLTGLPNRLAFGRRLAEVCDTARGDDGGVAVLYVDLDGFKEVNDAHGHPVGDALLCEVGRRLAAVVADGDMVARLGGDEFAVLRPHVRRAQEAAQPATAVVAALREPYALEGQRIEIGASVGVAVGTGWGIAPEELLRRADVALYQAKAAGKNAFRFFDRSFDEGLRAKRALELALRRAIERRAELFVVYQPVFDARGSHVLGAEALVRWRRPGKGIVSPGEFLALAEDRGLIDDLGELVLDAACATVRRSGLPWVAVNASASQFRDPGFADRVLARLDANRLTPDRLQIEITETLLLDPSEVVARGILKLRFAGVKVSLDDFGTGFSSLSYLTRLRIDKIKIDRSFVRGLGTPEGASAVVKAILDLGHALDLDITAEGVETEAERAVLESLGAPEIQGFLFSEPLEEPALFALLARGTAATGT